MGLDKILQSCVEREEEMAQERREIKIGEVEGFVRSVLETQEREFHNLSSQVL